MRDMHTAPHVINIFPLRMNRSQYFLSGNSIPDFSLRAERSLVTTVFNPSTEINVNGKFFITTEYLRINGILSIDLKVILKFPLKFQITIPGENKYCSKMWSSQKGPTRLWDLTFVYLLFSFMVSL